MNMKGKKVMFVGDSLGRNQWESLICMTLSAVPQSATKMITGDPLSTFKFLVKHLSDFDYSVIDRFEYGGWSGA